MTPEQESMLLAYEELKQAEKEIKARAEDMKKEIEKFLQDEDVEIPLRSGKLVTMHRDTWSFSDAIKVEIEALEEKKDLEKANGIAVCKVTRYVQYNPNK